MSAPVTARRRSLGFALTIVTLGAFLLASAPTALAAPATSVPRTVNQPTEIQPAANQLTATPVPAITGTPQAGRRLTSAPGTWKPAPVTLSYRWKVNGVSVPGATASVFTPANSHVGKRVTVTVAGTKAGYQTVSKTSPATRVVAPATIAVGANPREIVVTADGRWAYVANGGAQTVSVIDTTTGTVVATIPLGGTPRALAVSTNQKQVFVSTCSDEKIYALNIATNSVAYSFRVGACGDLVATPDGKSLYIGGSPSLFDITVATIATRSVAEPIFTGAPVGELTPSADRTKVYLSNGDDYGVIIIDTAAPQRPLKEFNTSHPPVASAPSPDGKTVYASLGRDLFTGPSNAVEVIDTATNRVRASIAITAPGALAVSPDGSKLYVLSTENNLIVTVSTATNRVLSRIPVGRAPSSLAVTPDGSRVGITNFGERTVSVLPVF
ncbi:beta-propeller fold lactonase family protein [Cryobacterium luteum]|uniref:YncE family protein n=1 Tax=Cryobacterium luteum TaxID=1424661 RepID=A0A1H8EVP6_9MICO|nr:YncE family protein [Cryobacterium luteum]TFB85422.1 YncE family protein [Cryobacterium luteum]SEN23470.1 40-residue YVTN family beta-propeller repeat-containing protein [Cryobacterium luteum]